MTGSQAKERGQRTRELITAAAASLVTEGGSEAVSVAAVMRRAGVSRTAFYRQFDGIHDVYAGTARGEDIVRSLR